MIPFSQSSSSNRIPTGQVQSRNLRKFFKAAKGGILMDRWRDGIFHLRDELQAYLLSEIRLYKGPSGVQHEVLLAELQSPSGTIYISTERVAWQPGGDEQHKFLERLSKSGGVRWNANPKNGLAQPTGSADDPNEGSDSSEGPGDGEDVVEDVVEDIVEGKGDGKADDNDHIDPLDRKHPLASTSSLSNSLFSRPSIDYWRKLDGKNFDEAIKHYEKKRLSRKGFVLRGSLEFGPNTDGKSPSTSSPSNNRPAQLPNVIHLTCAALSTHRTAPVYTPGGNNCFWYANAVIRILRESFRHSDLKLDKQAGTLAVAGLNVPLGALDHEDRPTLMQNYNDCLYELRILDQLKFHQEAEVERRVKVEQARLAEEHERMVRELQAKDEEREREVRELRAQLAAGTSSNTK